MGDPDPATWAIIAASLGVRWQEALSQDPKSRMELRHFSVGGGPPNLLDQAFTPLDVF